MKSEVEKLMRIGGDDLEFRQDAGEISDGRWFKSETYESKEWYERKERSTFTTTHHLYL